MVRPNEHSLLQHALRIHLPLLRRDDQSLCQPVHRTLRPYHPQYFFLLVPCLLAYVVVLVGTFVRQGRNYNSMRLLLRDDLLLNSQHTTKILTSPDGEFSPSSLLAMYWRTMLHTFVDKYPLTSLRPIKIWV
jgi:hypothetical protein